MAIAGFIAIDFHVLKESFSLKISITSRGAAIAAILPLLFYSYRATEPRRLHLLNFLNTLLVFSHLMIANTVRLSDQITLVSWDIVAIFACYALVPLSLGQQITAAIYLTIGSSIVWFVLKMSLWSPFEIVSILGAYLYANIFGIFISKRMNISRRNVFRLLNEEKSAKTKLENAIKEIKTLQGILPICAYCKKIRNDKGYWDKLEKYLIEHTDANFSHGVCPQCLKKEMPEIYEKMLKQGKIPLSEQETGSLSNEQLEIGRPTKKK